MPELPEVETMRRDLEQFAQGRVIEEVDVYDDRVIKDLSVARFRKVLTGQIIQRVDRRSKALILHLMPSKTFLVVQVKMTGNFLYSFEKRNKKDFSETKVVFDLCNGSYLHYNDHRTFGWLIYTTDLNKIPYITSAGPEPLGDEFHSEWLQKELKKRSAPIKTLLLNQHFLAGIGNIYASEILFDAGIHPKKVAKRLTKMQSVALHESTVRILEEAIRMRGTSMRDYRDSSGNKGEFLNRIQVYGRTDQPCPKCEKPILRSVQAGRSTFYCSSCQK